MDGERKGGAMPGVPVPDRMAGLPRWGGLPVPRFVAWVGVGRPDFRVFDGRHLSACVRRRLCWLCGQPLGVHLTFAIGPMCAINRISSEPPSHRECARYAVRACPFLSDPARERRTDGLPGAVEKPAGVMLARNPGVTLLWHTRSYEVVRQGRGSLFRVGDHDALEWWRCGREATREEVLASIESGMPALAGMAQAEGMAAVAELARRTVDAMRLLPAAAAGAGSP